MDTHNHHFFHTAISPACLSCMRQLCLQKIHITASLQFSAPATDQSHPGPCTQSIQAQRLTLEIFQILAADLSPEGRKGSFIGVRRLANEELPAPGDDPPPTNEAVAQAVQEKVAVSMLLTFINAMWQIYHSCHKQSVSHVVTLLLLLICNNTAAQATTYLP